MHIHKDNYGWMDKECRSISESVRWRSEKYSAIWTAALLALLLLGNMANVQADDCYFRARLQVQHHF